MEGDAFYLKSIVYHTYIGLCSLQQLPKVMYTFRSCHILTIQILASNRNLMQWLYESLV